MDGAELHAERRACMQLSAVSVCECVSKMTNVVVLLPAVEYMISFVTNGGSEGVESK